MENDEFIKRLEWLDGERRKDKQLIAELVESLSSLTDEVNRQKNLLKSTESEIKKVGHSIVRADEFDEAVSKIKTEYQQRLSELEKKMNSYEKKTDAQRTEDVEAVSKRVLEIKNEIKGIAEMKKAVQARVDEDYRISQKIEDISKLIPDIRLANEDVQRTQKLIEEKIRLESKRVSDNQIEVSTLRKRIDEERVSTDSQKEFIRKLELRINDLQNQEQARKQEQNTFIENQSRMQVDRENMWKDWESRFEQLETIGPNFQSQLSELEETKRNLRNAQGEFEEINLRLDRRINEITEMNRLVEERFRQEWISFKADDQKRWTNYALTQEEQSREGNREIVRIQERLVRLEELVNNLVDSVNLINLETEKQIKNLLTLSNEMLTSFEQSMGKRV